MNTSVEKQLFDAKEKLTQELLIAHSGRLLKAGWSDNAVVSHCEGVAETYFENLTRRLKGRGEV